MSCSTIWSLDDFTGCTRHLYLEQYFMGLLLGGSVLGIAAGTAQRCFNGKKKTLAEEQPLLDGPAAKDYLTMQDVVENDTGINKNTLTPAEKHFDISQINPVKSDGTPLATLRIVYRTSAERWKVAFEAILVVLHVVLASIPFFIPEIASEWTDSGYPIVMYVALVYWSWLLILCGTRLINVSKGLNKLPDLWYYTFSMYLLQWFVSVVLFRSALIGNAATTQAKQYYIAEFVLDTLLFILSGSCRFSDRPVIEADQDDIYPSPEMKTPFWSLMSYSWIDSLVLKAHRKSIELSEVWGLRYDDYAYPVLMRFHNSQHYGKFAYNLFSQSKGLLILQVTLTIFDGILVFAPALILKLILEYIDHPDEVPRNMAWLYVALMFGSEIVSAFFSNRSLYLGRRICTRVRATVTGEIYAKALRRRLTADGNAEITSDLQNEEETGGVVEKDPSTVKERDMGSIINLMAVDAFKLSDVFAYLHYFINALVMLVVASVLLYNLLGWAAIVGCVTLLMLVPINYKISMIVGNLQKRMLKVTDERIQKLNETFQNIRIVKFFAWESKFEQDIMDVRMRELHYLRDRCLVWVGACFFWMATPTIVCTISFFFYTMIEGHLLTTPVAFTALSLFSLLKVPLDNFADMLSSVVQSIVSLDRIDEYLNEPECSKYDQLTAKRGPTSPLIGFENATFSWSKHSKNDFKLRDINISFQPGKLNVVIGSTGSGKSSILMALLGEMELDKGKVFLPGSTPKEELTVNPVTGLTESVAYCAQTPWLLNGTIRENILFASPFDKLRYINVIAACGLTRDLEILDGGDATQIGDKGVTLSGGQKQRVSLARALYSSAAYVLLDDCLSAVDSHTAVHIYEQCITGTLMKNRTCILVSHNVSLTVREAAWVVLMEDGRVKNQGVVEQLIDEGEFDADITSSVIASRTPSSADLTKLGEEDADSPENLLQRTAAVLEKEEQETDSDKGKLVEEEHKSEGAVDPKVYKDYLKYFATNSEWTLMAILDILEQAIIVAQSWWLRVWTRAASDGVHTMVIDGAVSVRNSVFLFVSSVEWNKPIITMFTSGAHTTKYYISIYALIGIISALVDCLIVAFAYFLGLGMSKKIFGVLLHKVVRAEIRFFDSTPVGRIMNRFSKDIEEIDQELPAYGEALVACTLSCASVFVVICMITPAFLILTVILIFLYTEVGIYYLGISRDLKRYEAITRSPIHQHFQETLVGVTTIRAYCDERRFLVDNMERIDNNNRPFFYVWLANRWLSFRSGFVGSLVILFSAALAVMASNKLDSGKVGISLSFAVTFTRSAFWVLRCYAQVELSMNSVERVQEYINDTKQEPPAHTPHDPPASWPEKGEIEVHDLSIRYAEHLPRVIKNISFSVEAAEKIGVVGRTGAGKSTIIQSFFRFVDPDSGYIKIDGLDITKIGLTPLRRGLTIIPQDPTLFAGPLRFNLDIYGEYLDNQMYESLRRVGLISPEEYEDVVNHKVTVVGEEENANKFLDLDGSITEGGGNLSQGERQLLCLARALLKSPKILMLDEATASIDYESDAKLQTTIRTEFSKSTIITIAHRLKTIIDYDCILVLDHGEVLEYAHPYVLLKDKKSQFRSMCEDTGEFDELYKLAKHAYHQAK